ncbi:MAG: DUF2975 domain-containing protein [Eubacterium sp.]|nr:DUF2975 domain-containing protein [Eubacterium sp.]
MWSKEKSVKLTHFIVRVCYVVLAVICVILPFIVTTEPVIFQISLLQLGGRYIIYPFYVIVPAGYVALICIDKLLSNIKTEIVFDCRNVKLLRTISWSCFFAAIVCLLAFVIICIAKEWPSVFLVILAAGAGFMGLVVRVVKNVFESAIKIKEENELTI